MDRNPLLFPVNKKLDRKDHPQALTSYLPEIQEFIKFNHYNILYPLLKCVQLWS